MRLYLLLPLILACGSSTPSNDGGTDASAGNDAGNDASNPVDSGSDAGSDAACPAPQGTACPTTAGNCKHIGMPCTAGGGQCPAPTACDKDLDGDAGAGICITIFACTPGHHDCGNGASCCNTPDTSNVPVCLPNQCLAADCTAE